LNKFNLPDLSIDFSHTYPSGRAVGEMFYEDLDADYNKELLLHIRSGTDDQESSIIEVLDGIDFPPKHHKTLS
jgi:hypothetical protein